MLEKNDCLSRVVCPLCEYGGAMPSVKGLVDPDEQVAKYGNLYGDRTISRWKICGRCGFVHQNPRPSIDVLNRFYEQGDYHSQAIPEVWQNPKKYMKFSEWYYREKINFALDRIEFTGDKVFDLGFGHGGILKLMENDGWTTAGVEPDQSLFQYAKNKLQLSHIHQVVFDENFDCESEQGLVVSNHTFEHIADLDSTMKGLIKMMRPGGYMLTVIPTYFRNRSPLSKLWMNAGHYSMFNHRSLSQLCARYGLEEVAYTYRGWRKEIDDLWHLARFTGEQIEPTLFYEDPEEVESYVNFWNPLNSIMYWPLHGPVGSFAKRRAAKLGIGKTIQKIRSQLAGKRGRAA